jgi:hypothetical protein
MISLLTGVYSVVIFITSRSIIQAGLRCRISEYFIGFSIYPAQSGCVCFGFILHLGHTQMEGFGQISDWKKDSLWFSGCFYALIYI